LTSCSGGRPNSRRYSLALDQRRQEAGFRYWLAQQFQQPDKCGLDLDCGHGGLPDGFARCGLGFAAAGRQKRAARRRE